VRGKIGGETVEIGFCNYSRDFISRAYVCIVYTRYNERCSYRST
jgi:hypothetical protein